MRDRGIKVRVRMNDVIVFKPTAKGWRDERFDVNAALVAWQRQLINGGPKAVQPITITMNPNDQTLALKNSRATARKEKVHSA